MSVIIGRCEHGKVVCAAIEDGVSVEELEEMATAYTLERVESVSLGSECGPCRRRYLANMKLLGVKA